VTSRAAAKPAVASRPVTAAARRLAISSGPMLQAPGA
jgi:hypothetical protein